MFQRWEYIREVPGYIPECGPINRVWYPSIPDNVGYNPLRHTLGALSTPPTFDKMKDSPITRQNTPIQMGAISTLPTFDKMKDSPITRQNTPIQTIAHSVRGYALVLGYGVKNIYKPS